jgi:hypothetical protein
MEQMGSWEGVEDLLNKIKEAGEGQEGNNGRDKPEKLKIKQENIS